MPIPAVHLKAGNVLSKRGLTSARTFPLAETPPSMGTGRAKRLAIVRYLDVEKSARYRPEPDGSATYCNIYAYDYCYLNGVYLPHVWWTKPAIADISKGIAVPAKYGVSLIELNANALFDWLRDFGPSFGWKQVKTLDELQKSANQGNVAVICAQRADLKRPGHITVVVPEDVPPLLAKRVSGKVSLPLQSQAGAENFCFSCGTRKWWEAPKFRPAGFWTHA